ncbi:MAG: CHC2 zinc finger domain-containing protein [Terriglobales bacterium]
MTDFFVRLGRTTDEFEALIAQARPLSEAERSGPGARMPGRTRAYVPTEASRLKAATRIEDWVSGYLSLIVQGGNYVARCPFHDDDTPSFVVFTATQTFHCFGCRAHGDVFTFLMRMRSINFAAACDVVRKAVNETHDGEAAA